MNALYPFDISLLPPMSHSFNSPALLQAVISARTELAELKGYTNGVLSPELLFLISIREAVASARLDNIHTSIESVFRQALLPDDEQLTNDKNIINYTYVIKNGASEPAEYYLTSYGIRNMHVNITNEYNGSEFRDYGNYVENPIVGKPFWSPSYKQVPYLVKNWGDFVNNSNSTIDPLVKCILGYYQIEAIHPFDDTCGRLSRMSLMIHLVKEKILSHPMLLISEYLNDNRIECFRLMRAVTTNNEWDNFILFMLQGFELQARVTRKKIFDIIDYQNQIKYEIANLSNTIPTHLVDYILTFPVTTSENVARDLKIEYEISINHLDTLVKNGFLDKSTESQSKLYYNRSLLELLN